MATIDTTQVRRIERSVTKQVGLVFGSLMFVTFGYWLTTDPSVYARYPVAPFVGWLSVAFFGLCALLWAHRLTFGKKWVVTLSPTGLTDVRISRTHVPWRSVRNIGTLTIKSTKFLCIDLDQQVMLEVSAFMRKLRTVNASIYGCGYPLGSTDLKVTFAELSDLVHAYWQAHGSTQTLTGPDPNTETTGA